MDCLFAVYILDIWRYPWRIDLQNVTQLRVHVGLQCHSANVPIAQLWIHWFSPWWQWRFFIDCSFSLNVHILAFPFPFNLLITFRIIEILAWGAIHLEAKICQTLHSDVFFTIKNISYRANVMFSESLIPKVTSPRESGRRAAIDSASRSPGASETTYW